MCAYRCEEDVRSPSPLGRLARSPSLEREPPRCQESCKARTIEERHEGRRCTPGSPRCGRRGYVVSSQRAERIRGAHPGGWVYTRTTPVWRRRKRTSKPCPMLTGSTLSGSTVVRARGSWCLEGWMFPRNSKIGELQSPVSLSPDCLEHCLCSLGYLMASVVLVGIFWGWEYNDCATACGRENRQPSAGHDSFFLIQKKNQPSPVQLLKSVYPAA